ncbi:hypothetical protein HID58_088122 [Brassica napus]|uniref:Uncharacterized protein n=1 Tax=Brassica napus TaxID=3708 RepID=A0ABQ7XVD2_BRANA|nr:hypothetical protein HID58_088122 [Brassica napus]
MLTEHELASSFPPPPFCEFLGAFCYCLLQGGGGSRRRRRLIQSSTQRSCLSSDLEAFVDSLRPSVFQFRKTSFQQLCFASFLHSKMGSSPAPFPDIGKKSKGKLADIRRCSLRCDSYVFDYLKICGSSKQGLHFRPKVYSDNAECHWNASSRYIQLMHMLQFPNMACDEWVATGLKKDDFFFGDISTLFKGQNTIVDLKIDGHSSVSTKVTIKNLMPSAKVVISFKIPYHKSGKLDVQYVHPHATLHYSIGLNQSPLLDLSATIGSQTICLGGEVGFDTASSLLTKYNAGIGFNKPDFFAALMFHDNSFTIGSSYSLDPFTTVKARLSNNGKAGMVVQSEWRPKSLVTLSDEYDSKAVTCSPELGLVLALKP